MSPHPVTRASTSPLATASPAAQAAARFWDRMARRYAAAKIADPAGYEATLRRVAGLLAPSHEVLELGCGTGTTALRLAAGVRRWQGTDVSAAMVAIARDKLAASPQPGLGFEQVDVLGALVTPATWDAVVAFNLLHLVDDLDATLRAARQALRPGGLFISKTPCLGEMNPLLTRGLVPLLRAVGLAPPLRRFDGEALRGAIEVAGFRVESVERHGTGRKDVRVFIVARRPR